MSKPKFILNQSIIFKDTKLSTSEMSGQVAEVLRKESTEWLYRVRPHAKSAPVTIDESQVVYYEKDNTWCTTGNSDLDDLDEHDQFDQGGGKVDSVFAEVIF